MFSFAAGPVNPLIALLRQFNLSFIGIRTGSAHPISTGSLTGMHLSAYPTGLESTEARIETFWEDWKAAEQAEPANSGCNQAALRLKDELGAQAALLEALHARQQQLLRERVEEVNEILSRLAELNTNADASAARQRKRAHLIRCLERLTGPLHVTQEEPAESGPITVALGETLLLQGEQHTCLSFSQKEPESSPVLVWKDAGPFQSGQGQIAGLLSLGEILLPSLLAGLASSRAVLERVLEDSQEDL